MNKFLLLFFLAMLLGSCQYFEKRVPSEEDLLQERLSQINWEEVTVYPSVRFCDSLTDKEAQKDCFFEYLTRLIQEKLSTDTLAVRYPKVDTIEVMITVFPDARITFEPQFLENSPYDKNVIDSIFQNRLRHFPAIEPAQKEGIPVKTQFILPVIVTVE